MTKSIRFTLLALLISLACICVFAACETDKPNDPKTETVTVTFDVNGGDALAEGSAVVEKGGTVTLPVPVREGYTFEGWFFGREESAQKANASSTYTTDTVLYAHWSENEPTAETVTVTFDVNGGDALAEGSAVVEKGGTVTLPVPVREGYTFEGWFFGREESAQRATSSTTYTADTTLYAHWADKLVTIASIKVYDMPDEYREGETIDVNEIMVLAIYSDSTAKVLSYSAWEREDGYSFEALSFDVGGTYEVVFYSWAKTAAGKSCMYTVTVNVLHNFVTAADGTQYCACGKTVTEYDIEDYLTAYGWGSSLTFRAAKSTPARLQEEGETTSLVSYGTLAPGESVTLAGMIDDANTSKGYYTPLIGLKTVEATHGMMLRMDNWIMDGPAGVIVRPSGSYGATAVGYNATMGTATSESSFWRVYIKDVGQLIQSNDDGFIRSSFTVTYTYRTDGIIEIVITDTTAYGTKTLVYTVNVPVGVYQLLMYGEYCDYCLTHYTRTSDRGAAELKADYSGEELLLEGEDFDFGSISVAFRGYVDPNYHTLSATEVLVYGVTKLLDGDHYTDLRRHPLNTSMEAILVCYGGLCEELEITVCNSLISVWTEGGASVAAGGSYTVTLYNSAGYKSTEVFSFAVNGVEKTVDNWSAGDSVGALTLTEITRASLSTELTFALAPVSFPANGSVATEALSYLLSFYNEAGRMLATERISYDSVVETDGQNGIVQLWSDFYFKLSGSRLYLFGYNGSHETAWHILFSGEENEGVYYTFGFSITHANAAFAPIAVNGLTTSDAVYYADNLLYGIYGDLTAVGLRADDAGEAFYFQIADVGGGRSSVWKAEGDTLTLLDVSDKTAYCLREANCGAGAIIAYKSSVTGDFLFGFHTSNRLGLHSWVTDDGTHSHCSVCGAKRELVTIGSTVYETIMLPEYAIENTDYSDLWYNEGNGSPVGRDVISLGKMYDDFTVRFTWDNIRDVNYQDGYAQLYAYDPRLGEYGFWTMEYNGGSGSLFDASNTTQVYTKTTTDGVTQTSSTPFLVWGKEGDFAGHYELTIFRAGTYLRVELRFEHKDGTVYTQTFTTNTFTSDETMVFVAGNPYFLDHFTFTYGSVTEYTAGD